jgi:tetratricopeptide (TPR) repeat protein
MGEQYIINYLSKKMKEPDILKALLYNYINSPDNAETNFNLGYFYHSIGQTASAISFYLRAAERSERRLLRYECLLRASICFESQGCRNNSVEGMLQHAVALFPERPEGYFYLSRFYERTKKWFHAYTIASIGEKVADKKPNEPINNLDYPGFYGIIFEKAVSAWWTGLCEESRDIFKYLSIHEPLDEIHKQAVFYNLKNLN